MIRLMLVLISSLGVLAIDQLSKWWVLDVLDLRNRLLIDVAPFLKFTLAWNTGVNFGIFSSGPEEQQYLLAGFAVLVSAVLSVWALRTQERLVVAGCVMITGGALGNALDRIREGAVVDFLNVDCCGIGNPFAFNVADVGIFLGAGLLVLSAWREQRNAR